MTDQFLKDYQHPPREAFADGLRRRLKTLEKEETVNPGLNSARNRPRRLAFAALALLLAISLALWISPAARAQLQTIFTDVGGILFNETGKYPAVLVSQVTIVPAEKLTLAQARESLPFEIALPEHLPEGYTLIDEVTVLNFAEYGILSASIRYRNPEPWLLPLGLSIHSQKDGQPWKQIIGPNSTEEVQVNGQPAALVRGIWNGATQRWDNPENISLWWPLHGVTYELQTVDSAISADELIRIAESIP